MDSANVKFILAEADSNWAKALWRMPRRGVSVTAMGLGVSERFSFWLFFLDLTFMQPLVGLELSRQASEIFSDRPETSPCWDVRPGLCLLWFGLCSVGNET